MPLEPMRPISVSFVPFGASQDPLCCTTNALNFDPTALYTALVDKNNKKHTQKIRPIAFAGTFFCHRIHTDTRSNSRDGFTAVDASAWQQLCPLAHDTRIVSFAKSVFCCVSPYQIAVVFELHFQEILGKEEKTYFRTTRPVQALSRVSMEICGPSGHTSESAQLHTVATHAASSAWHPCGGAGA